MRRLVNLIPPELRAVDYLPKDINEAGMIVGFARDENDQFSGALLTPVDLDMSEPTPGRAGEENTVEVKGLVPGEVVQIVYGRREGYSTLPEDCGGIGVSLRNPRVGAEATADADGVATLRAVVPDRFRGRVVRLQARATNSCRVSHLIPFTFE